MSIATVASRGFVGGSIATVVNRGFLIKSLITSSTPSNIFSKKDILVNLMDLSDGVNPNKGASLISGKRTDSGAIAYTQREKNNQTLSIFDFLTSAQRDDVRSYLATIDVTTQVGNAVAALGDTGGTVIFPPGKYLFSSSLNLDDARYMSFQGSSGLTPGATPGTEFNFTGTGSGRFISLRSAVGCYLKDIKINYTEAFTGDIVNFQHSAIANDAAMCGVIRCSIGNSNGAHTTANGINLDQAIEISIENCSFYYLNTAITGMGSGSYSNSVRIRDCQFTATAAQPIVYGGQGWLVEGNVFEGMTGSTPGAFTSSSGQFPRGMVWTNNWHGDCSAAGTWLAVYGRGIDIRGNYFGGNLSATCISLNGVVGFSIQSNEFDTFGIAIDFTAAGNDRGIVEPNKFTNVTNKYGSTSNFLGYASSLYLYLSNGKISQWGSASVTTGTPTTVTFPVAMTGSPETAIVTLDTPSAGANTCYLTNVSTTGMDINVAGTAGSNTAYWHVIGTV